MFGFFKLIIFRLHFSKILIISVSMDFLISSLTILFSKIKNFEMFLNEMSLWVKMKCNFTYIINVHKWVDDVIIEFKNIFNVFTDPFQCASFASTHLTSLLQNKFTIKHFIFCQFFLVKVQLKCLIRHFFIHSLYRPLIF